MNTTTTTTALGNLMADYHHCAGLEQEDDPFVLARRLSLMLAAHDERQALLAALRECVEAMQAAADDMGKMPHQTWRYLGMIPADLLAAAAKAREVLGD